MAGIGAVNDTRLDNDGLDHTSYPTTVLEKLHDPSIPIEGYMYYAKITRAEEDRLYGPGSDYQHTDGAATAFIKERILRKRANRRVSVAQPRLSISAQGAPQMAAESGNDSSNEKGSKDRNFAPMTISDEEWVQASRAARTATWYVNVARLDLPWLTFI
jgi:hypothetical protein